VRETRLCGSQGCAGAKAVQEIVAKRQLHPTQVSAWTWQAIEGMAGVF
jgi:hypothetical protein